MKTPRASSAVLLAVTALVVLVGLLQWRDRSRVKANSAEAPGGPDGRDAGRAALKISRQPAESREQGTQPATAATVQRIRDLLTTLEPVLPGEVENKAAIGLLEWWAESDPVGAIEYAASHPALHGRANLPAELFMAWLDAKGAVALKWATALPSGALRSELLPTVISHEAAQHPQNALHLAAELTGEARVKALLAIFSEWSARDPIAGIAQATQLPSPDEQRLALRQIVQKWADHDLKAAIAWAKHLPPEPAPDSLDIHPGVLEALLEKWAGQAPMEAARHLISMPEGPRRIQMLGAVAGQWADQNSREALAWAAGLPGEADRTMMVRGVIAGVAQADVQKAASLALTLPAGVAEQGLDLVLGQWLASNPSAVATWATSQVESASTKKTLTPLVTAWADSDLNSLGRWLNTQPTGEARDVCCAALARHLAPTHPALAKEWADAISNPLPR